MKPDYLDSELDAGALTYVGAQPMPFYRENENGAHAVLVVVLGS